MPRARKHLVSPADTPYYHVMSRCVRRAFLCGFDHYSGQSYEHRRQWIEDRLRVLASLFSVEICAYAVMSNHYHLVVCLDPEGTSTWSDDDVLVRWTTLFKGPLLVQQYLKGETLSAAETATLTEIISVYRERLASLSWFMRCLNEPIARRANAEDRCTGHFWESRFISQALKSQKSLISAMAYVDLNPVRAGIAKTPEASMYTSIHTRIRTMQDKTKASQSLSDAVQRLLSNGEIRRVPTRIRPLATFAARTDQKLKTRSEQTVIPIPREDYLELVDVTGRFATKGKRGVINPRIKPILKRLGLTQKQWLQSSSQFERHYRNGDIRQIAS